MAKNSRRIPEDKVFVTRELFKEVTTLILVQVIQSDQIYHYRKLNDRQSR